MVKFTFYLYKTCHLAKTEGWIYLENPKKAKGLKFDHLDQIPMKIRDHLKSIGLGYATTADSTVIIPKKRKTSAKMPLDPQAPKPNSGFEQ